MAWRAREYKGLSVSQPADTVPRLCGSAGVPPPSVRTHTEGPDVSGPGRRSSSRPPEDEGEAELRRALAKGDPQHVRALIDAGANIHYKREHGYDALIDAVHGRDVARDERLLEMLALLIEQGVDLSGETPYNESALRVLSGLGRFDAVRLLLNAGADRRHLEWTPLMEAVALGSLADVQRVLQQAPSLEDRDYWSRTTWPIAVLTGDTAKAGLLLESGADPHARDRSGCPSTFDAIQAHHPEMLRWLLAQGVSIHATSERGTTALITAVQHDDLECVNILLEAGADAGADVNATALERARSRAVALRLLDAGANPADANQRVVLGLPNPEDDQDADGALAAVSLAEFQNARTRVFGRRNPERMGFPFWLAMIRAGVSAHRAGVRFEKKSKTCDKREPIWSAMRSGQSLTLLPDGRAVQIGGGHKAHLDDPDFCTYNDVFVHELGGAITIYGYPEADFPPTNYHTATLIGDHIYVIGSLGDAEMRRYGETPVFRLDVRTMRMERLSNRGDAPGWIYWHRAAAIGSTAIRVSGGAVVTKKGRGESHDGNTDRFVLDLKNLVWCRESATA